jgi:hypothetical protein
VEQDEIVTKLRELQQCKAGGPIPDWMKINQWGDPLSELGGAAADLIEKQQQWMSMARKLLTELLRPDQP